MAPDVAQRFENALTMRLALAPFAGKLSHAGQLAATPPPGAPPTWLLGGMTDRTPAPQRAATPAAPPAAAPPAAAPPAATPPAATPPYFGPERGSTQDISPEEIQRNIQLSAQLPMRPIPPTAGYVTPAPGTYPSIPPRRPRRAFGAVLAILLGVLVTGGAIAAVVAIRNQSASEDDTPLAPLSPAPATTISAQAPQADITPTAPRQASPLPTPTRAPRAAPRARSDAGADAGPKNPFPFQFPSAFPTTFPTAFPSGFPTTLPIPGFPPPAQTNQPLGDKHR